MSIASNSTETPDIYAELQCIFTYEVPNSQCSVVRCHSCKSLIGLGIMFLHFGIVEVCEEFDVSSCSSPVCDGIFGKHEDGGDASVVCHECALPLLELIVDDEEMTPSERFEYYRQKHRETKDRELRIRCRRKMPVIKTKSAKNKAKPSS